MKKRKKERKNEKVIVAMSGGLDSSVAAALLKKAGVDELRSSSHFANSRVFDVVGVFMKFWKAPDDNGLIGGWNRCCSPESEARARKVAKILKIPFYVFNFEKEFKKRIVDYFLKEHKKGITPNPCVVCNKEIKFGLLLEKALKLNADFVATGHYARKQKIENREQKIEYKLLRAKDKNKDQSYFLWKLNQKQLRRILFPVGNYTRNEVERLAKKLKLPVLGAKKSVEICFIKTTINDFLQKYLKQKPGKIICSSPGDEQIVVGEHKGLWFYTIGQRKGLGLTGGPAFAKASAGKPYYVLDKDFKKNLLIVTKNERDLYKKELTAKNANWVSDKIPEFPLRIKAKIRYRHELARAIITKTLNPKTYILKFEKSQRAITPGQSVVFYSPAQVLPCKIWEGKGQELSGGGIIC